MTDFDLRAWRKKHNVRQKTLAYYLGVAPDTVGRWERGVAPMKDGVQLACIGYWYLYIKEEV